MKSFLLAPPKENVLITLRVMGFRHAERDDYYEAPPRRGNSVPILMAVAVFFIFSSPPPTSYAQEVPSVEEIFEMEKQIIESRRSIRSGRVALRLRTPVFPQNPELVGVDKRYVVYFEGDKIRYDLESAEGGTPYRETIVFGGETYIRAFDNANDISLFGPTTRPPSSQEMRDPRPLGLVCWSYETLSSMGYEDMLLAADRDQFTIEAGTGAGEPVWKVSFHVSRNGYDLFGEYWLPKTRGKPPVYLAWRSAQGEEKYSRSLRSELKRYGASGIWFPSEVTFRIIQEGNVTAEQIVTVEDAVFENDIPDDTFGLAGLGVPEGTAVNADGQILTWDGERLVDGRASRREPTLPGRSAFRLWMVAISAILALVAAVLLWSRQRKRA